MSKGLNILVIEDNPADFMLLQRQLRQDGLNAQCHRVESESALWDALTQGVGEGVGHDVDQLSWDILLSDYRVPGMDITETLCRIRERYPDLPLILVSGAVGEEIAVDLLKQGVWDFVIKDHPGRLLPAINRALSEAGARRIQRETEVSYSDLFESIGDAICILDKDCIILEVNKAAERLHGYARELMIGKTPMAFLAETDGNNLSVIKAAIRRAYEGISGYVEFYGLHSGGESFPGELRFHPTSYKGQRAVIVLARDISERKLAEALKLKSQEQQSILRILLETTLGGGTLEETLGQFMDRLMEVSWLALLPKGGILLMSEDRQCLRMALAHNLGPEVEEMCDRVPLGHCLCGRAADTGQIKYASCVDDLHDNTFPGMKEHGHYNLPLVSNGEVMGVLVLYLPPDYQRDALKEQFLTSVADILAGYLVRKQAEQQLIDQQEHLEEQVTIRTAELDSARIEAERLSQVKSTFLATMSHEIRTPMNALLGMLELVGLDGLTAKQERKMEVAQESGKSLLRIIDDILDFSKIESGKLEINPEPASIADLVKWMSDFYTSLASNKGLQLVCHIAPDISPAVMVDRLRLRQILNNFLSNAIKFTEQGQIDLKVELLEQCEGMDHLQFSVSDTGVGIDPEYQQQLFQPFTQADSEITRRFGGTGLGLAICRRLADMMGGDIKLQSESGQGTTLTLTLSLPVIDVELLHEARKKGNSVTQPATKQAIAEAEVAQTAGKLILLVDDSSINREMLTYQLEVLGYTSEEASNGDEAFRMWQQGSYDLLITDCHMPDMDGYQLTREIRRYEIETLRPRIPILAWTGDAMKEAFAECEAAGMDDVLIKPSNMDSLKEKLTSLLHKHRNSTTMD